jgi:predicted dehydrogenase
MAIDLSPEQRAAGEANFKKASEKLGLSRRDFLKGGILATGALAGSAAAVYFGYQSVQGNPVRAALIGAGDEGGVLVGEHNPEFLKFVAVADIRQSNLTRVFEGEPRGLRKGFKKVYGLGVQRQGHPDYIEAFTDWEEMLRSRQDIEAVVIALPLHLHAPVAVRAMKIGQERGKPIHVLCEKLMAWNIKQCKQMIQVAKETGSVLSIGHQRHYSMVYAHALEVLKSGILGDVKHIRALWHRNFSWPYRHDQKLGKQVQGITPPAIRDGWFQPVLERDYNGLQELASEQNKTLDQFLKDAGYDSVEQLIRWRLYPRTGGGLMAELGSHQLDACSIFLGKVKPLAVSGVGGKYYFGPGKNDRQIDDHVFVTYEFPGKNHPRGPNHGNDPNDVVVVTYSSISTNSLEAYGECVMGTRGSMIVEAEQRVMLYTEKDPTNPKQKGDPKQLSVDVSTLKKSEAAADSSGTWGAPVAAVSAGQAAGGAAAGPPSRGYREEMEDFAYCVRTWDAKLGYEKKDGKYSQRLPRCHGEVAMADAIVALTANQAMREKGRIVFDEKWFDAEAEAVPDDPKATPQVEVKME